MWLRALGDPTLSGDLNLIQGVTYCSQDHIVCSPTGRDCIEGAIGQDFNCSVSCEGIYADVQWLGVSDGEEKKAEHQWTMLNGKMEKDEEDLNKKKILALVDEYNAFKKRNVRHFRFNAEATEESYGETRQKIYFDLIPD